MPRGTVGGAGAQLRESCAAVGPVPEMTVETELNGADVLRVRPEGRFGLPIEPSSAYGYPGQGRSSVL
jgi:hypothetical protein